MRVFGFCCLFVLFSGAGNAAVITATAYGGSQFQQQTSSTSASASVFEYYDDGYDSYTLDVGASGGLTSAGAHNDSYASDYSLLSGGADVEVLAKAKIVGGSGPVYVSFVIYGGAGDGLVSFDALGQSVSFCCGDGDYVFTNEIPFFFNQPFKYSLYASIYATSFNGSNFISWEDTQLSDRFGRTLDGASVVFGRAAEIPEPSTYAMALAGLMFAALRRRRG